MANKHQKLAQKFQYCTAVNQHNVRSTTCDNTSARNTFGQWAMMILFAGLSCTFGFTLLSLGMPRHRKAMGLGPIEIAAERLFFYLGLLCLCSSLRLILLTTSIANGILMWFGMATFSSLFVALFLSFKTARKTYRIAKTS